jgi:Domain of unknown function (DUF4382)
MKNHWIVFLKQLLSCAALLMAAFLVACGSSDDGGSAAGTMSVSLTDAPACGFDQVNVTVSKVRVHQSSSADDKAAGWTDITLDPPKKINLLDFNDPTKPIHVEPLGLTPLEPGHYTQLRLVLVPNTGSLPLANSVVLSGTTDEIPLDTPSGVQSGIKLIHQFTVNSGQRVDLLLDFDACKSVLQTGNGKYKLKPMIKVIPFVLNGINGFVDKTLTNVRVSAQQNGNIVRETVMNTQTGEFFLAHLDPGNYDVVITADNHAMAVISEVPVSSTTSITTISTSGTPFTLAASSTQNINGTVTLNPADDDGTVIVAAKQTLNPGPTVTVKSQVAALIAGNPVGDYSYALTLPTGAPLLAAFGPLPITPTAAAQSAVAKMYTVHGSATTDTTVYTTQTPAPAVADITAVPTKNFTLTP